MPLHEAHAPTLDTLGGASVLSLIAAAAYAAIDAEMIDGGDDGGIARRRCVRCQHDRCAPLLSSHHLQREPIRMTLEDTLCP